MTVSSLVVLSSLTSLISLWLVTLSERRREMAILRSVGRPRIVFYLLWMRQPFSALSVFSGTYFSIRWIDCSRACYTRSTWPAFPEWLDKRIFNSFIDHGLWNVDEFFPAWRAYMISLHDGLLPKA